MKVQTKFVFSVTFFKKILNFLSDPFIKSTQYALDDLKYRNINEYMSPNNALLFSLVVLF